MQTLRIYLLGNVELHLGNKRLGGFATKKSKALFAYLVLGKGKLFSREQLADVFWGDLPECRARRALSTDLWRIGNLLKDGGADPDAYLISDSDSRSASTRMRRTGSMSSVSRPRPAGSTASIRPPPTGSWSTRSPRPYRCIAAICWRACTTMVPGAARRTADAAHLGALEFLMQCNMAQEYWANALAIGQRILSIDPFMEHVQRAVMRCHYSLGNRPAAVKQYATCAQLLRQELDVEPMEETRQILETIVAAPAANGFQGGCRHRAASATATARSRCAWRRSPGRSPASMRHAAA